MGGQGWGDGRFRVGGQGLGQVLVDVAVDGEHGGAGTVHVAGEEGRQCGLSAAALADERDAHYRSVAIAVLKMNVMWLGFRGWPRGCQIQWIKGDPGAIQG